MYNIEMTTTNEQIADSQYSEKKIYRSRQPVTNNLGQTGYLDFWTSSYSRAKEESSKSEDRILEEVTLEQIQKMPPGSFARASAAWEKAFPE